jgi:4-hydroxybenzoate polyprenyltransferase
MPAHLEPRWRLLLRIGSIRFSAFYFAPFYAAIDATGGGPGWIPGGAAFCLLMCLGVELLNRATDRYEDAINNPARTELCRQLGYQDIAVIATVIFAALVPVGLAWLLLCWNVQLFLTQTMVWLVAWNYSFGLRLKARRVAALFALAGTFLLPFLSGWTIHGSLLALPPLALYPPLVAASLSGAKDITDVAGDLRRGYRSLFVEMLARRSARRLFALVLLPHAALLLGWALGLAPTRALWLLPLAPATALQVLLARAARAPTERRAVRELTYHLWMAAILGTLYLMRPSPRLAVVLAGAALFWVIATRWLHWTRGLDRAQLRELARVGRRALAG